MIKKILNFLYELGSCTQGAPPPSGNFLLEYNSHLKEYYSEENVKLRENKQNAMLGIYSYKRKNKRSLQRRIDKALR